MEAHFPKDTRLVIGCKSGGRSMQAAALLERLGFQNLVDQRAGFDGSGAEPGWRPAGLPVATDAAPERTWDGLKGGAR
jgi:rhodanese-related sulfurtransferase